MDSVKNRYNELNENWNFKWDTLTEALVISANETIPKKTRQGRKECKEI